MNFQLHSDYKPAGDQPKAIEQLTAGVESGEKYQTLLGVTGSGKTFTMANVIENVQKPTLVIAHNKTLAAQLCNEFREFFPENAVEYFVSYYDYYQPEAYMPRTDTYIEKESQINEEIDRLRHSATQALLSRRDVIIVASVSCIYALGSPDEYKQTVLHVETTGNPPSSPLGKGGDLLSRNEMLRRLTEMQFERTTADITRGHFRARGDIVEVMPMNEEVVYRVVFEDEKVVDIQSLDPVTRKFIDKLHDVWIFPAKHYVVSQPRQKEALREIRQELEDRLALFDKEGKVLEAERLSRRTRFDLEMIQNIGYCSGIENYSRHFDGRTPGQPPYTLIDYFPSDFLTIIDESHVTVSQVGGMYNGDKARKETLIEHGFRLPSAKDNRPLRFDEFEERMKQVVFVSATPGKYELEHCFRPSTSNFRPLIVEQIIRPTGLVDPEVHVRPVTSSLHSPFRGVSDGAKAPEKYEGQVEDLIAEIEKRVAQKERALVTTLTKKMAEDLTEFLVGKGIKVQYLHSDVQTLDRITILSDLRKGAYDVVVGVNLLREGLDLPEVTLVAILDADKEGFLRSETSIIQTIGRAARNVKGEVIVYADELTGSLKRALKETERRRKIQLIYNKEHGIMPQSIKKQIKDIRVMLGGDETSTAGILKLEMTAEPHEIEHVIKEKEYEMKEAAKKLDFETAAILRDEIALLAKELKQNKLK